MYGLKDKMMRLISSAKDKLISKLLVAIGCYRKKIVKYERYIQRANNIILKIINKGNKDV